MTIRDNIENAIEKGQVAMRPRWHFVLRTILLALGVLLSALTLVFLVSFAVFTLRQSGAWFAPGFGLRGVGELIRSLPWLIVIVALAFIFLLEILVKQYAFAYRKPVLYSVVGVVAFAMLGGAVVAKTELHAALRERARNFDLPVAGPLYRGYGMMRPEHMDAGEVLEKLEDGFRVRSPRGEEVRVIIEPGAKLPGPRDILPGDHIMIMGEREDGSIRAEALRELKKGNLRVPAPGRMFRKMK